MSDFFESRKCFPFFGVAVLNAKNVFVYICTAVVCEAAGEFVSFPDADFGVGESVQNFGGRVIGLVRAFSKDVVGAQFGKGDFVSVWANEVVSVVG